jgi:acetyl-CoA C-acetyltransferase
LRGAGFPVAAFDPIVVRHIAFQETTMSDIVICNPVRTPIGGFGGSLKDTPAAALGAHAIAAVLRRSGLDPARVESVVMGNVVQAGNGMNVSRQAAIHAGLPVAVPAMTVNRVCGSGAQAIATAYAEVASGVSRLAIAGGMENMDRAPYLLPGMRFGARLGNAEAIDALLHDGLHDAFSTRHSGWHTEDLVHKHGLTRQAQDAYAAQSQQRFAAAQAAGWFAAEIEPMTLKGRKGEVVFAADESSRPETTVESLARLKPAFRPDGTITAGNAPGVNAGAAAMVVCDAKTATDENLEPMLAIRGIGVAGVEPGYFGLGPLPAIRQALQRAGWQVGDVDRFEVNEAFAAIALVVRDELDIDPSRFNVDGGAIAHGHPIGATGAILVTKVAHALERTGGKRAVVSLCIGGGQGIALCLERLT